MSNKLEAYLEEISHFLSGRAERILPKIKFGIKFTLLFIALMTTFDLIKNLVIIGRANLSNKLINKDVTST